MQHKPKNKESDPDKITRKELSELAGISETTIRTARTKGLITFESLNIICKALDVSPDYLQGHNDNSVQFSVMPLPGDIELSEDPQAGKEINNFYKKWIQDTQKITETNNQLRALNRIDKDGIYINHYSENTAPVLSESDVKDFLLRFIDSDFYIRGIASCMNDGKQISIADKTISPWLQEYIETAFIKDLTISISDFIRGKQNGKRKNRTH